MFCVNCGKELSDDALFCPNCGTKVEPMPSQEQPVQSAPQYEQQPQYSQQVQYNQQPQYSQAQPYGQMPQYNGQPMPANGGKKKKKTGLIVGIIIGIVAVIVAVVMCLGIFVFDWFEKDNKSKSDREDKKTESIKEDEDETDEDEIETDDYNNYVQSDDNDYSTVTEPKYPYGQDSAEGAVNMLLYAIGENDPESVLYYMPYEIAEALAKENNLSSAEAYAQKLCDAISSYGDDLYMTYEDYKETSFSDDDLEDFNQKLQEEGIGYRITQAKEASVIAVLMDENYDEVKRDSVGDETKFVVVEINGLWYAMPA